jgi:uracil-DNA glycosylase
MKPRRTASFARRRGRIPRAEVKKATAPCTSEPVSITGSAADFMPPSPTVTKMRAAAQGCRGCALYACGTQAVFSDGPVRARVMFVGEQPGDVEDKLGKTFVGPAGKLLDQVLDDVGIERSEVYLTNAVKHFKWARAATNKKRIHKSPSVGEVKACFPWLEREMRIVKPDVIVCLGATAAKAVLGKSFSVMKERGKRQKSEWAPVVIATVHPSAVLRAPREERQQARADFTADLKKVAVALAAWRKPQRSAKQWRTSGSPTRSWKGSSRKSARAVTK